MITVINLFKNQHPPPFGGFFLTCRSWSLWLHPIRSRERCVVRRCCAVGSTQGLWPWLWEWFGKMWKTLKDETLETREWKEFMLKEARCQRKIKIKNASEWNMDFVVLSFLCLPEMFSYFSVVLHDLWQVLRIRGFSMMPWWKPLAIFYLLSPRSKDHVEQVAGVPVFRDMDGHGTYSKLVHVPLPAGWIH